MSSPRNRSATCRDLDGKTISVDLPNGGTFVTALTVFERLGMKPKVVYIEQRIAMEKLKRGEIDAVIVCGGKPYKSVSSFKDDRFHLVTVNYEKPLQGDYLPATLSAKDYPNLISEGEQVDTIAVPAVLAAYNWAPKTDRYRKVALFVDNFFAKFPDLPESALPSEVEGSFAVGPAGRLATLPGRPAMARQPWHRAGGARPVRRIPQAESARRRESSPPAPRRTRCSSNSRPGRPSSRTMQGPRSGLRKTSARA